MITVGKIFDNRYLILQELGEGGMAKVYKARQIDAEREVALKFLKEVESKERFFREFKVLAELRHEHIMTVYGMAVYADTTPYAICEFLEGKNLQEVIQEKGSLSWEETVDIALQIANALEYAHNAGVVHRDLKPENIILLDKPHPNFAKLIDFGLSKAFNRADEKLTMTGQLLGTPMYMSPEQISHGASYLSDIYSFGCIIFEMLSGEHLFPSDLPVTAIYKHSTERATARISAVRGAVPEKLMRLVLEMLAKNPKERIQSASDVRKCLLDIKKSPGEMADTKSSSAKKISLSASALITMVALFVIAAIALFAFQRSIRSAIRPSQSTLNYPKQSFARQISDLERQSGKLHSVNVETGSL